MKQADRYQNRARSSFASRLLATGLCLCAAAFSTTLMASPQLAAPPIIVPAAASSVPVAQQPLRVRQPIPPNIVLMLDDSGSMRWDIMPDWEYLPAPGGGDLADGWLHSNPDSLLPLMDSNVNGVYYNPTVTYTPPPKADGTLYPASAFTAAPLDGFDPASVKVDLTTYRGQLDMNDTDYTEGGSSVQYSMAVKDTGATAVAAGGCPSGWGTSTRYPGYCSNSFGDPHPSHWISFSDTANNYFYATRCDSLTDVYDYNGGTGGDTCTPGIGFFIYVTGPKSGPFATHYVSAASGACATAGLPATAGDTCIDADSADAAAILQNIANWFTYYHTRILLAKSGLMRAFDGMNPKYRLGFGSINNDNEAFIKTLVDGSGNNLYTKSNGKYIADVTTFGDGSAGTQRANFWEWASTIQPASSTPLRVALQAVGQYYQLKAPWKSSDSDQYLACRQSYVILTTDGFWNGGSTSVGNVDGKAGTTVTGPTNDPFTYSPHDPLKDSQSNTLADVAMNYWSKDLRSDISNEVPTNDADPAFWQHMVTFTIGMGFTPSDAAGNPIDSDAVSALFQWEQSGTKPASLDGWGGWPTPSGDGGGSINNIADLVHAGVDGHGGFYSATNPESFIAGLKNALLRAQVRTGTGASLAANSTQLKTGTMAYQAIYHTAIWTGELDAYPVDPVTGKISTVPVHDPATGATVAVPWTSSIPVASDRNIQTYVPASGAWTAGSGTAVAFKNSGAATPPALSAAELASLGTDATHQAAMVNYLRGDDTQNTTYGYRNRAAAMGDIVDSQPVFVGAPDPNEFFGETFTGSSSYGAFAVAQANVTGLIYVAANDGMLHAFHANASPSDADRGKEVYAFMPASVITHGGEDGSGNVVGISQLADPTYGQALGTAPHQFFNDGQLTVADAYFGSAWHTVLVGTTGRGLAKTIYALDVTDPTDVKFLWERSAWDGAANSGYIGQMTGKPVIAQVADGNWVVLIGNGYNSANGVAALLQFDLADGTLSVHKTTDATTGNGLAAPAVWIGTPGNGISTMAYAGDLHGQVWSFALSKIVTNPDGSTSIAATPTSQGTELFTAKDGSGNVQPITAGMLVGRDPDSNNLWVFFGTGRYLSFADLSDTSVQTWYGLIVDAPSDETLVSNLSSGRSALAKRAIIAQTAGDSSADPPVLPARVVSPPDDPDTVSMDGKSGWYLDLQTPTMNPDGTVSGYVSSGERMVQPSQFQGSRLVGTTRLPTSDDLCNPSGTGWVMAVDPFTGTNPKPQFFDINGDGVINSADMVTVGGKSYAAAGVGFDALPNSPIFVGRAALISFDTGANKSLMTSGGGSNLKRVSWREMVNQ